MTLKALMRVFILFQFILIANCMERDLVVDALKILFKEINKPLQPIAVLCWSVGEYIIQQFFIRNLNIYLMK